MYTNEDLINILDDGADELTKICLDIELLSIHDFGMPEVEDDAGALFKDAEKLLSLVDERRKQVVYEIEHPQTYKEWMADQI